MRYSFLLRDAALGFRFGSALISKGSGAGGGCRRFSLSLRSFLPWSFLISFRVLAILLTFSLPHVQTDIEISGTSIPGNQSLSRDPQLRP